MNAIKYTAESLATALVPYEFQIESYDEMLDQAGAVEVAGFDYYPSHILQNVDPTAYSLGFGDYLSECISEGLWTEIDGDVYVTEMLEEEETETEEA